MTMKTKIATSSVLLLGLSTLVSAQSVRPSTQTMSATIAANNERMAPGYPYATGYLTALSVWFSTMGHYFFY